MPNSRMQQIKPSVREGPQFGNPCEKSPFRGLLGEISVAKLFICGGNWECNHAAFGLCLRNFSPSGLDRHLPGKHSVPFFWATVAGFRGKVDGN